MVWGILFFVVMGLLPELVQAQNSDILLVSAPNTSNFPSIDFEVKVPASARKSIEQLDPEKIIVTENGDERPVLSVDELDKGVLFTLVINGDRRFDLRDANGTSPFDRMRDTLADWAMSRTFVRGDLWSVIAGEEMLIRTSAAPEQWVGTLEDYQPNFRAMQPTTESLEMAIQFARDYSVPFGADKALLYITPPPAPGEIPVINELTETAREAGIQVNVWMFGEDFFLTNDQGRSLINLAEITGGDFYHLTGIADLPDPESYLSSLGTAFQLVYQSGLQAAGTYSLEVSVELPEGSLRGASTPFFIEILPPKPILISPPARVTLYEDPDEADLSDALVTEQVRFNLLVDFPDGFERDLVASRLFVNEVMISEKTQAPFDQLTWDLSTVTESGEYLVQVEIEDQVGLLARTVLTPVQIDWVPADPGFQLTSQQLAWIIVGVFLVGSLALLVPWSARQPAVQKRIRQWRSALLKEQQPIEHVDADPIDQDDIPQVHFIPLESSLSSFQESRIEISQPAALIGSDQGQAGIVLDGSGIDPLHASIRYLEDNFFLSDQGSQRGTWVNYQRIGKAPVKINPGDLIHFGNCGFRFTMGDARVKNQVSIEPYKPIL